MIGKALELLGAGLGFLIGAAFLVVMVGGGVVSHSVCVDRQTGQVTTGEWGVDPLSWFGAVSLDERRVCESETGWQYVAGEVPVVGDGLAGMLGGPHDAASYVIDRARESQGDGEEATARRLLDSWAVVLVANLRLQQARVNAADAPGMERAAALERRVFRGLRTVEKFGGDARAALVDSGNSGAARAVTRAGDAWSEWAYVLRTAPPRGDFDAAREIADLGAEALRLHRQAYRAIGATIPAPFRVG